MRINNFLLLFLLCLFISACATSKSDKNNFAKNVELKLPIYIKAVENLAEKLSKAIKEIKHDFEYDYNNKVKRSFYISNKDAENIDFEYELSRRFIEDLKASLVNKKIIIKRKELTTWAKSTGISYQGKCDEIFHISPSDYLIDFSLRECPEGDNCVEARIQSSANSSNVIEMSLKEQFQLTGNVKKWRNIKNKIKYKKGNKKNPYEDINEASKYMLKKISCLAKTMITDIETDNETMKVIVEKTETSRDIKQSFGEMLSFYGLEQVIMRGKLLNVALRANDQFKLVVYEDHHNERFKTANVVLAIDTKEIKPGMFFVRAQLMTLKKIEILKDGKISKLEAGEAIPYCVDSGYVSTDALGRTISAIDVGICNKDLDKELWESSAIDSAKLGAEAKLIEKVNHRINSRRLIKNNTIDESQIESLRKAYIRDSRVVSSQFNPDTCKAIVKCEIEEGNISPISNFQHDNNLDLNSISQENNYLRNENKIEYKNPYITKNKTMNPIEIYQKAQDKMISQIEHNLHERLKRNNILPTIVEKIKIKGKLYLPDCRVDSNYLYEEDNILKRYFCGLQFDLKITFNNKELLNTNGTTTGTGSNNDAAWQDALSGISDKLYSLTSNLSLALSNKISMKELQESMKDYDDTILKADESINTYLNLDEIASELNNFY